ncbi:helix-turn-helix domain-containing protein [Isachenkonia alkalipeptolytica]|uniref:Helix-turn-helix domain-containing protein n=2 Tax=Isachenkonia alkalipeptolytica TaxID=2565777 RepID=A0AA44BE83_9CLOT|nr:helix-turn-helix domain-containing protein [Isachenkonia alkalipeptolytica]
MDFGEMLTSEDVKKRLLLGRSKVYQILRSGKLKSVRIDRQYRVSESALKSYILEHESGDFEPKA